MLLLCVCCRRVARTRCDPRLLYIVRQIRLLRVSLVGNLRCCAVGLLLYYAALLCCFACYHSVPKTDGQNRLLCVCL